MILSGIHPVVEALRGGRAIERVTIAKGAGGARIQEIVDLCRRASVPVRFEDRAALDRLARNAVHQGVVAHAAEVKYGAVEDIADSVRLVVALDGVEDPHNLGAILRTAHAAGAGAVLIPERRAASVTGVVAKAAAGALEHVPLVRVTNLNRALESLKKRGYWIYGLDERGAEDYDKIEYNVPTVIVAGGEGKGLHQLTREHCDGVVRIPMAGAIASLNVSVAVGVALFEWRRRFGR
ncbi:MAG: 23S rRNA (guanosine(2251)-2'-O)-methyltransferase RlmB [Bryobacteraceae bacterium]